METLQLKPDRNIDRNTIRLTPRATQAGSTPLFPRKLHGMLQKCASEGNENIVSWVSEGRAFKVHNVPDFVSKILPLYFKQSKYKSFQRQLNLWGFERILTGSDKGAYHHPLFLQQRPGLCSRLKRRGYKKLVPVDPMKTARMSMATTRNPLFFSSQVTPIQRPDEMKMEMTRNDPSPIPKQVSMESMNSDASTSSQAVLPSQVLPILKHQMMEYERTDLRVPNQLLPIQRPQMKVNLIPNELLAIEKPLMNPPPRQVSEGSVPDPFENLCFKIDPKMFEDENNQPEESNLADFEGGTFYLLDEERYEELNHEFGVSTTRHQPPPETQVVLTNHHQRALLEQLERGYLGVLNAQLMT